MKNPDRGSRNGRGICAGGEGERQRPSRVENRVRVAHCGRVGRLGKGGGQFGALLLAVAERASVLTSRRSGRRDHAGGGCGWGARARRRRGRPGRPRNARRLRRRRIPRLLPASPAARRRLRLVRDLSTLVEEPADGALEPRADGTQCLFYPPPAEPHRAQLALRVVRLISCRLRTRATGTARVAARTRRSE